MQQTDHWTSHAFYSLIAHARNTSAFPEAKEQRLPRKPPGCPCAPNPLGGLPAPQIQMPACLEWHWPCTVASPLQQNRFSCLRVGPAEWPCSWRCSRVQYAMALHSSQKNQLNHERIYQKIHVLFKGGCLLMIKKIPDTPWSKKTPIPLSINTKTNIPVQKALQNNRRIDTLLVAWHEQVSQGNTSAARAPCLDVTLEVSPGNHSDKRPLSMIHHACSQSVEKI